MATVEAQVAHVWRRLGFGPTSTDIDAGVAVGVGALIDDLTSRAATPESSWAFPSGDSWEDMNAFADRMIALMATSTNPLEERVAWILLGLYVCSINGADYEDMYEWVKMLRRRSRSTYKAMLTEGSTLAGMLKYLSGNYSTKWHPNENYGRELMELFSLGVFHPKTGARNYTESDVAEVARALTGYYVSWPDNVVHFRSNWWDSGNKTFLGADRGAAAVPQVIDAVVGHDSFKYWVPERFWHELVGTAPSTAVRDGMAAAWGPDGNIWALVSYIAHRPEFVADAAIGARVKGPVELVAGAVRQLGLVDISEIDLGWRLVDHLGQHPLRCPVVKGWPSGPVGLKWLHSGHLLGWSWLCQSLCWLDDGTAATPPARQLPGIRRLATEATADKVALALKIAGLPGADAQTLAALHAYVDSKAWSHWRACGLMNLVLVSPAYLVN